jgi:hypothetical protein
MALFDRLFGIGAAEAPELVMARAMEELKLKQNSVVQTWGLGRSGVSWSIDLSLGLINFTLPDGMVAYAAVQVIGTFDTRDETFVWGWDQPSIPEKCRTGARRVRSWGKAHGLTKMTRPEITCNEGDAWAYTALALHLSGAQGGYRGPAGNTSVFMTFGKVRLGARDIGQRATPI